MTVGCGCAATASVMHELPRACCISTPWVVLLAVLGDALKRKSIGQVLTGLDKSDRCGHKDSTVPACAGATWRR